MNKNLTEVIFDCAKVDALMYAYEAAYLCVDHNDGDLKERDRAEHAFYAIWDAVHKVQDDLEIIVKTNVPGQIDD